MKNRIEYAIEFERELEAIKPWYKSDLLKAWKAVLSERTVKAWKQFKEALRVSIAQANEYENNWDCYIPDSDCD